MFAHAAAPLAEHAKNPGPRCGAARGMGYTVNVPANEA